MRTTPNEVKLYEWHLAYRSGKSIMVIYCPQIKRAWAYIKRDWVIRNEDEALKMVIAQAHQYHDGTAEGEPLKDYENYLALAKIRCTYKLEL